MNSKKSGGSNHLNLEESADEPKRRKKTAFGSGNTMSKGVNALRADLQTREKTILELKTENEELRRSLKSHIARSNKINQPWLKESSFHSSVDLL